jgi:glutamate-1-semialdehyde 2,1-aminomutase
VVPDISVLGKLVGGGFPCGTIAGNDEVMQVLDPRISQKAIISGTFSGNPVSMTAGVQALTHFTEEAVSRMEKQMDRIEAGLKSSAKKHGLPFSTRRAGNLMNLFFQDKLPEVLQLRSDSHFVDKFQLACINNGIFIVTRICINSSSVVSERDVDEIVQRFDQAIADVAAEV